MTLARQLTVTMVAVALLTGTMVGAVVGFGVGDALKPIEEAHLQSRMRAEIERLRDYVADASADVRALAAAPPLRVLLDARANHAPSPAAEHDLMSSLSRALLGAKPHYLQVLVVTAQGHLQLLRVEHQANTEPVLAMPEKLDSQLMDHEATLVQRALAQPGAVLLSTVQLHEKLDQIVVPHVPVLHAAVALSDASGQAIGVVMLTIAMARAFTQLSESLRTATGALYLFDQHGNFIIHPDSRRLFGRDLGTGEDLSRSFPTFPLAHQGTTMWHGALPDPNAVGTSAHFAQSFSLPGGPALVLLARGVSTESAASLGASRAIMGVELLAVLLAALAALLLSRTVTQPLAVMTRVAERYPAADAASLPVEAAGEIGVLARALERMNAHVRQSSARAAQEQLRFQRVFDLAPNAGLIIDRELRIVQANRRAAELFGYRQSELVGGELSMLLPASLRERHAALAQAFFEKPSNRPMALGRTFPILNRTGSAIQVEVALATLTSEPTAEVLVSVIDVSDRVRSENALRQSNRELEQFAYVASHDLQEPLRVVANYTELLARRYQSQLDERAEKYVHYIVDGSRRMQRLIKDLLTYSHVESRGSSFIRVDLNEVVKQVLDALQLSIAEAQAEVVVGPLPWVNADPTQMHQVFQNLVGNAIKFRAERIPRIIISATPEVGSPERVRISVRDNGIGIDPSDADKLFGMFQRGHQRERYPGTGIGLAVSKRVIERHAGRIWVEPTPGGGSTFLFTLPTAQPRNAGSAEPDERQQQGASNGDGVNHQSTDR